ncbi:MAG: FlgD immunoglobulin-like domain containing protein, partial [Calditrichota bacterium]
GQNTNYLNSTALNARPDGYGRFEPGNAFWLYLRNDDDGAIPATSLSFPEMQTVSPDSFVYTLQPGWNQIGNPYSFPIPWDGVRSAFKEALQIYRWNGEAWLDSLGKAGWTPLLNQNLILEPWTGFAVLNTTDNFVNIVFDPTSVIGVGIGGKKDPVEKNVGWQVILQAENEIGFDINIAGMHPQASNEQDHFDYPDPSSPEGRGVAIVFDRNNWAAANPLFATDIRTYTPEGGLWEFGIRSSGSAVDLNIPEMQNLPENFTVAIYDAKFNRRYFPAEGENIVLRAVNNDERNRFSLYVGPETLLNDVLSGIERLVPNKSALSQNFPNPFNPTTIIPYQVAQDGRVKLRIYSVLGQLIRTLVNENQSAGYHEISWDGRSDSGREAASGIYFYMLESAGEQSVKRLLKLK